jgi:hypothetical protein
LDVFLVKVVEAIPSVGGAARGKLGTSLEETRKFYWNKLTVDLKLFSNWDKIEEMQALRNELVHRLGLVDPKSKYREKHKYRPRHANITGPDLRDWFEVVLSFAEWVSKESVPGWPTDRRSVYRARETADLQILNSMLFPQATAHGKERRR